MASDEFNTTQPGDAPSNWGVDDKGASVPTGEARDLSLVRATIRNSDANIAMRRWMVSVMCVIFLGLNAGMGFLLLRAFDMDASMLNKRLIEPGQRLLTENTFMALIGATVVQVGLGIAAMVAYLFPKPNAGGQDRPV